MNLTNSANGTLTLCYLILVWASIARATELETGAGKRATIQDDELPSASLIVDESHELKDDDLSNIMEDFGQHIKSVMAGEMEKLISEVEESKVGVDQDELKRFKSANEMVARDAEKSIEQAGQKNMGQFTQSGSSNTVSQESLINQVSQRLQSAGSYIGQKLSSLNWLAPRTKGKWDSIPFRLRKLLHWPTFLNFKIKFNKHYKSIREELYRQMIFLRSQTIVGIQRLKYLMGRSSYLLKATEFSDWTNMEQKKRHANELAENDQLDGDERQELSQATRDKLEALARDKRNIFGKSIEHVIDKTLVRHHRRRKRSIDLNQEAFINELDEEEDEEDNDDSDDFAVDDDSSEMAHEGDNSDIKVVDEYASEFKDAASNDLSSDTKLDSFEPIDLRETGCVVKVENQHTCGNCYAQAVSAALSYFNCISGPGEATIRKSTRYSARFVSDCGRYMWNEGERPYINGCQGGRLLKAIQFARLAGTHKFMDYVFARESFDNSKSDNCAFPRPDDLENWAPIQSDHFKLNKYVNLKMSDIDLHLRTVGPVLVNILSWKNFKDHGEGIFDSKEDADTTIPHSMMIVGHDIDSRGRDYWIVWNSFGVAWGERGYVRIYNDVLEYFKMHLGGFEPLEDSDRQ